MRKSPFKGNENLNNGGDGAAGGGNKSSMSKLEPLRGQQENANVNVNGVGYTPQLKRV